MQQEREYAAIFANLLADAEKKGLLREGFDLSVVRMLALGALTWAAEWYDPQGSMTAEGVADELMAMLRTGRATIAAMSRAPSATGQCANICAGRHSLFCSSLIRRA